MVYSSLLYIYGFLPTALLLYYISPKKLREIVLLLLSMLFCGMISLYFLFFISVFTLVNFFCTRLIKKMRNNEKLAAIPLTLGITFDLLALFSFRTAYFSWLHNLIRAPESFYPIGISFFALSSIGTMIDVYKGRVKADIRIIKFTLYIIFFPKLLMGPLLRYDSFSRIINKRRSSLSGIGVGMTIFVKGFAKKVIAADNLYMLYRTVHSENVGDISAATAWLGIIAYVFCLYFNLSGIADMGTGAAYCFGIKMPQSFNYPLLSARIKYFASRWQSQVVQWFRRYITKPLYNICHKKWTREIIFVCGWALFMFWYTFDINGLICGIILGIFIIIEARLRESQKMDFTGIFYTFLVVILCAVFLLGNSPSYSVRYLFAMIGANGDFVDSQCFYLLKSYIVLILLAMYASTDLFRNLMVRTGKSKIKVGLTLVSPLMVIILLIICTALISYSGSSETLLMKL